jgi:glycosyltransferase involved in cell wall biosynthesis
MKIAHLSKPWLPVPSQKYGAIEKILGYLLEHQKNFDKIYLFAPATSLVGKHIELVSLFEDGQDNKGLDRNAELVQAVHCALFCRDQSVNLIHVHSVEAFLALTSFLSNSCVFTYYSNPTSAGEILCQFSSPRVFFTFLSESHRKNFPWIEHAEVVYPGVNLKTISFSPNKQNYLAFVGSMSDKKGILEAIEIARKANLPLKIGGKVRIEDQDWYEKNAKRTIECSNFVEFLGEIDNFQRDHLLKYARALLFPIKWEEPFGLVMIEAMAAGTPVIAFNRGAVPEVIVDKRTGFIVNTIEEAVEAINCLGFIHPHDCRKRVENLFTATRMAQDYEKLYQRMTRIS